MPELTPLAEAVSRVREQEVKSLLAEQLASGVAPDQILAECNQGMTELGNRFAREECYLPELMFGGMVMKTVMAELQPHLSGERGAKQAGTAVMGSVQHDVHDIGKDIVVMMLRGSGFDVVDLGVDVAPDAFVRAIREHQPQLVGMSVLLTTCYSSVTETVNAICQAGLRDGLKLMVGGAAASPLLAEKTGCDFYGKTAVDGARYAASLLAAG
ncbi:MAG: cobalamin-dependent protein [Patescibacteria group bacterium]|nr:cobalamin-dependent protein [Patescibacteria group bacterium]